MAHTQRSIRRVLGPIGRFGRISWWTSLGVAFLLFRIADNRASVHETGKLVLSMLLAVLVLWLLATAHCKRLHDIGRTGWWQILAWIPIVNLGMVAWLGFSKGQATANQYGPAPRAWWRVGASGDPEYSTPQIETGLSERLDDNKAP